MKIKPQIDVSAEKSDILVTLGIAALLNLTDQAVQECAKTLIARAPGSICKSVLRPMAETPDALDAVMETIVFPTEEMHIGHVTNGNYQYELWVVYRGPLDYDVEDVVSMVTKLFVQRGIVKGRIYLSFRYLFRRGNYTTSVDMDQASRYNAHEDSKVA